MYTDIEMVIIDVAADSQFQMQMLEKLNNFYYNFFRPALIAEKVYKNADQFY